MKPKLNQRRSGQTASKTDLSRNTSDEDSNSNMENNPLHEVFLDELADIYNAEKQLVKALPKMVKAATSEELRQAFEDHLEETRLHAERVEEVAASLDAKLKNKRCRAMEGLILEASEMLKEFKGKPSLDAVMIAGAQKVEHYEIAGYGTLAAWAKQMGHEEAARLLETTLAEEKAADEKLSEIATSVANAQAED